VTGENSRPRKISQGVAPGESRALVLVREFPAGGERRDLSSPSSRGRRRSRRDEFCGMSVDIFVGLFDACPCGRCLPLVG
jgi:hypothetical protein